MRRWPGSSRCWRKTRTTSPLCSGCPPPSFSRTRPTKWVSGRISGVIPTGTLPCGHADPRRQPVQTTSSAPRVAIFMPIRPYRDVPQACSHWSPPPCPRPRMWPRGQARNALKRIAKMPYTMEMAEEFEQAYLHLAHLYIERGKYDLAQARIVDAPALPAACTAASKTQRRGPRGARCELTASVPRAHGGVFPSRRHTSIEVTPWRSPFLSVLRRRLGPPSRSSTRTGGGIGHGCYCCCCCGSGSGQSAGRVPEALRTRSPTPSRRPLPRRSLRYTKRQDLCRRCLGYNKSCPQAWETMGLLMEKEQNFR